MGGTGRLVSELFRLMERTGVSIVKNTDIAEILIKNGRATGARCQNGTIFMADRVICNADPPTVYGEMLPETVSRRKRPLPETLNKYSMGLFVLFFGTRKTYPDLAHHTIWMGPRFKELLSDIFDRKILSDDFSLYIHRPTATDPSFAPDGCDSFYVLCPVPNLLGEIDWKEQGPGLRSRIIEALDSTIMPDLKSTVTDDFWMTPEDFKSNYRSMHGAGFSIAPIFLNLPGFAITIEIHIFQICIFQQLVRTRCRNTRCVMLC